MRDVTILYQGGSGGFLLFYYLLLSGLYNTGLEFDSVQELINQQYPNTLIDQPNLWKTKEFWPDNQKCKLTKNSPRLFLICNPVWSLNDFKNNLAISANTHKILLYTDFKLQLRMCWEKQAYWFTDKSKQAFNAPENSKQYIKQIINTQVDNLDPQVRVVEKLFTPTQKINLTDFVKTKELPGFVSPTYLQLDFLNHWIELQPKKIQKMFL